MDPSSPDPAYKLPKAERQHPAEVPSGMQASADSDSELVQRMARREARALGYFYDRFAPMVSSLVGALLHDSDDAEEIVEEAFWQAWRQAGRYEASRGGVSTWIGMIARSRALDRLRSKRRLREERWEQLPQRSLVDDEFLPSATSPLKSAADAERRERIQAALRELPEEQRRAIELAYFQGMSQSEIAEHTGQPLGTVKTRVRLGMQKLRDRLESLRGEST